MGVIIDILYFYAKYMNFYLIIFNYPAMKRLILNLLLLIFVLSLNSCATILGGKVTEFQRRKPLDGEPSRKVRAVALIADIILFWPGAIVDFATGAIYQPDKRTEAEKADSNKLQKL
jgi:hypothetical protein